MTAAAGVGNQCAVHLGHSFYSVLCKFLSLTCYSRLHLDGPEERTVIIALI